MSIIDKVKSINAAVITIKSALKSALVAKGVPVADQKLKDYPELVKSISSGLNTDDATAVSADIRSGKTAYVKGSLITGSMQNTSLYQDGYLTVACNGGYVDGYQYLTLTDSNLIADNIKKDVTIFGVTGTYEGDALNIVVSDTEPANPVEGMIWIDTSVADDEGGSGSGEVTGKQTLTLSGFTASDGSDIYGVDVNGEYVLDDETKTAYDRTWTCATNNVTLKFGYGYWYLSSSSNAAGGDTYTYGDTTNGNPYNTDGSSTQWECRGAIISGTAIVKDGNSGEGEGGNDTSTSYLLVSGFSASNFGGSGTTEDPNGKYYLQDETATGYDRVWVSESGHFKIFHPSGGNWYLDGVNTYLGDSVYPYGERASDGSPYKEDGSSCEWWSMGSLISGASVTLVSGSEGGESGGESGGSGENRALFRVSGAGSTEANGDYFDTGETKNNLPIYKNENNIYMYFSTQCGYSWAPGWCLSPTVIDEGSGMLYCTFGNNADTYPTDMLISWGTLDGVSPTPVCRELDENGNEIIPVDYTVTGAGSPNVNGEYREDGTHNGKPLYKNEKGTYLFYCLNAGQTVFGTDPNDEGSASWYYYHETYGGEIAEGDWGTNAPYPYIGGLGVSPFPTVVKG